MSFDGVMEPLTGIEPASCCLRGSRSTRLSFRGEGALGDSIEAAHGVATHHVPATGAEDEGASAQGFEPSGRPRALSFRSSGSCTDLASWSLTLWATDP